MACLNIPPSQRDQQMAAIVRKYLACRRRETRCRNYNRRKKHAADQLRLYRRSCSLFDVSMPECL